MLLACFYIAIGFILLIASGDRFVNSAAQLPRHYKLSPVLIGVTIAAFGSSAPEILISIYNKGSLFQAPCFLKLGNAIWYGFDVGWLAVWLKDCLFG